MSIFSLSSKLRLDSSFVSGLSHWIKRYNNISLSHSFDKLINSIESTTVLKPKQPTHLQRNNKPKRFSSQFHPISELSTTVFFFGITQNETKRKEIEDLSSLIRGLHDYVMTFSIQIARTNIITDLCFWLYPNLSKQEQNHKGSHSFFMFGFSSN